MSSPWGKVPQVQSIDLSEIMSQEIAKDLQLKENAIIAAACQIEKHNEKASEAVLECVNIVNMIDEKFVSVQKSVDVAAVEICQDESMLKTDLEIALVLQQQYDKEYDQILKHTENKYNGASKISVSFSNYRRVPLNTDFESDIEEEEEEPNPKLDWDRFDGVQRDCAAMPPCGYRMKDGNMVTKHDNTLNARQNACKMMSFPLEFETGDGAGFDLQLPNKVFNSLRKHSKQEITRRNRFHDRREEHATAEFGMDESTRLLVYKMINKQLLEQVNGVISIGKEAVVLHAECNTDNPDLQLPKECVLKVFKTTLSEYKQRDKYIKDDYRFKDRIGKQNTKKVVHLWAEKEMRNLNRIKRANIPAPDVFALKHHVLMLSFIGKEHKPAPKLKEANMSDADYIVAYEQVIECMKNLYNKANLIHADLSEYNILWYQDQCYIIDVSQAVEPSHENAFHFLMRDCTNISHFFERKGVSGVETPEELFKSIVGHKFTDKIGLLELQENFKMKPHLVDRDVRLNYNFDQAWERTEISKRNLESRTAMVEPPVA